MGSQHPFSFGSHGIYTVKLCRVLSPTPKFIHRAAFTISSSDKRNAYVMPWQEAPDTDLPILGVLGLVSTSMFYLVYRKIYRRWRHQQLEANIVDVV